MSRAIPERTWLDAGWCVDANNIGSTGEVKELLTDSGRWIDLSSSLWGVQKWN